MSALDDRLTHIVTCVERSHIGEQEKQEVYEMLQLGLHATVLPVLAKHVPKDLLSFLDAKKDAVTAAEYVGLVNATIRDGMALSEIETLMHTVVDAVEDVLKREQIIH